MRMKPISCIYLNYFLKYSKNLEGLYLVESDEYSKEWINKKSFLAKQALTLYKYGNELIINKFYDNEEDSRYYFFLLDMIFSKLKRSIFTETPKTEIFDVYTFLYKEDLAFTGERLKEYDRNDKLFDIEFQRFIFKSFLMFDFIYYKDDGIFTRYELNRELFEEVKKT